MPSRRNSHNSKTETFIPDPNALTAVSSPNDSSINNTVSNDEIKLNEPIIPEPVHESINTDIPESNGTTSPIKSFVPPLIQKYNYMTEIANNPNVDPNLMNGIYNGTNSVNILKRRTPMPPVTNTSRYAIENGDYDNTTVSYISSDLNGIASTTQHNNNKPKPKFRLGLSILGLAVIVIVSFLILRFTLNSLMYKEPKYNIMIRLIQASNVECNNFNVIHEFDASQFYNIVTQLYYSSKVKKFIIPSCVQQTLEKDMQNRLMNHDKLFEYIKELKNRIAIQEHSHGNVNSKLEDELREKSRIYDHDFKILNEANIKILENAVPKEI